MPAKKYFLSEEEKQYFLDTFDGTSACAQRLSKKFNVPRHTIHDWARAFGVHQKQRRYWTEEELDYLKQAWGDTSLPFMAKKLNRSPVSVRQRAARMGLMSIQEDKINRIELCDALGCCDRTIGQWIARGWLKGTQSGKGAHWSFSDKQIRDFIFAHPDQVNQHRVDWLWVVDILSGDIGIGELYPGHKKGEN